MSFLANNDRRNCSSKTGSRRQSEKRTILKPFLKELLKEKSPAPKLKNHSNTIQEPQLQKAIVCIMETAAAARNIDAATIQCVLQHHVANPHVSMHTEQNMATIMQPLHCANCNQGFHKGIELRTKKHTVQNTMEEPKNIKTSVHAPAAHTSCPSSPAAATLHGKNTRFRAPASSPTQVPCNIHAATTLRLIFM